MIITKRSLPRRTFLRGVGATLSLPLLDAMVPALSALSQTPAQPRMRMGFLYVPNGIQMENFRPAGDGAGFEMTPILHPLEPYRDQTVVLGGLANALANPLDVGSGTHARASAVWLNGVRPKRTEGADIRAGTTIDQFAARSLGDETPLRSLELALEPNFIVGNCEGGYSCVYVNTFSWRTAHHAAADGDQPARRLRAPVRAGRRPRGAAGADAQGPQPARRGDRGHAPPAAGARSARPRHRGRLSSTRSATWSGGCRRAATRRRVAGARHGSAARHPDSFAEHARLMFDLQLLAYQADITRVITFQIGRELSTRSYAELGVLESHHDISHHQSDPERMAKNTKINQFHMGLFAEFVQKLRATPDGDGSLLDHSMLLYGGGLGDGHRHLPHDLPLVLVGGGCGQLSGGRHLVVETDTPMMNLGLTLLDKVGVELDGIGDSTGRLTDL